MPAVKPNPVTDIEPLQGPAEVGFRGLEQQMKVIVHEHIGVDLRAITLDHFSQQFQEVEPIGIVPIEGLALVASGGDMIAAVGSLDTQWACHGQVSRHPAGDRSSRKCRMFRCDPDAVQRYQGTQPEIGQVANVECLDVTPMPFRGIKAPSRRSVKSQM